MREPRWVTPRPTAAAAVVGLVLAVVLSAVAPSPWSGGWRPTGADTGLWVPPPAGAHQSTAPRLTPSGTEHLPTPGQLRHLLAVVAAVASPVLLLLAWLNAGPAANPRRTVQRIVTLRSPPLS
ncbi:MULTISPECIES: hypothetical protein [Streptosporangium]|uniref:Uncharacterized protein n=1 Tax=Streptosporangium brasiliense TaxID=47480 RepID=A0ABT9RCH7_9ACTN|nr:hypothetical protein [Streptosporangium brasiliense]MDP9866964.1 hypothetical protein [Streptosporangium brasiliense]